MRVTDRSGAVLYDSARKINKQPNALEALAVGRKLNDSKLSEVTKAWGAVEAVARQRGAPGGYLDVVSGHVQRLEDMQKERINSYVPDVSDLAGRATPRQRPKPGPEFEL